MVTLSFLDLNPFVRSHFWILLPRSKDHDFYSIDFTVIFYL